MIRKRFLSTAAMTLLLLILAEGGVRWLRPSGTIPYEVGGEAAYQALGPELQEYGAAELAIVGSSRSREGVAAPVLRSALKGAAKGWKVGNYSLVGATAADVEIVVRRLLETKPPPRLIAYGVEIVALEKGPGEGLTKKAPYIWRFSDAIEARSRIGARADRYLARATRNSLSDRSFLLRLRPEVYESLQQPSYKKLKKGLSKAIAYDGKDQTPMRGGLSSRQRSSARNSSMKVTDAHVRKYLRDDYGEGKWPHREQAARIDAMAQAAKRAKVDFLLIEVPLSPLLKRNLPKGTLESFYEIMQAVADRNHIPFVRMSDLDAEFPQSDYAEQSHLNLKGAKKLAQYWANAINARTKQRRN
jgi:hypothetical protein